MPTIVEIELKDGNSITWEYLDNPFAQKHAALLREAIDSNFQWRDISYGVPQTFIPVWNAKIIDGLLEEIKECIDTVNTYVDPITLKNIQYPISTDDIFFVEGDHLKNQKLLNIVHRFFTMFNMSIGDIFTGQSKSVDGISTRASWHYTVHTIKQQISEHDYNVLGHNSKYIPSLVFNISTDDVQSIKRTVEKTNDLVHELEKYCLTPNKLKMKEDSSYVEYTVEFSPIKTYHISPHDRKFMTHDNTVADVWCVQTQILGKNYPVAYTDHDDPSNWDVWEGTSFSGSFAIGDRSYVNWEPFDKWLKNHGVHGSPAGLPLGKIIKGKEYLPKKGLKNGSIRSITLHETRKTEAQ